MVLCSGKSTAAVDYLRLHRTNHSCAKRPIARRLLFGALALAVLWADIPAGFGQALPSGGGQIPPLRRGANGQIEVVRPSALARPELEQQGAVSRPKAPPTGSNPHRAPAPAPIKASRGPPQPVIRVTPITPYVRDTARPGTVVATYAVEMSDGSPFTGTVRFGAPFYDAGGIFALSGNQIIVNTGGPGVGPNRTTLTRHITLEAIP